ncbi:hypothetical protein SI65_03266 [Aspergillus cristatus]|uniref:ABC transmembrane type-1 domain-containing protein n=1 Tax=Aspergillus cristatus TaxID=573508 RepID=A0A1E3BGX0_ASPCR|nr:hypothetical protein SI65_03266 [Aspergillus cristatus]
MLPDCDLTEVGGQGATLSGGQQWRISLARALYSRAGTLLMDDVFSAVDVHTRQHMCQHALTGALARRRTCILVTHHLNLCLPYASYIVVLDHGILKHAAPVSSASSVPENEDSQSHASHVRDIAQITAYDDNENPQDLRTGIHTAGQIFIREGGKIYPWILLGVAFFRYGCLMLARSWWIHVWTDRYQSHTDEQNGESHLLYYLGVYIGISTLTCLFGICHTYFSLSATLRASQKLFQLLLFVLLRSPLQWHDSIPFGAILSRFSTDYAMLDTRVGDNLQATLDLSMDVMIAILVGSIVNPMMVIVAACLLGVYIWLSGEYLIASRKVKHLENAAKGPILEHIDAGINGISTIRAYA